MCLVGEGGDCTHTGNTGGFHVEEDAKGWMKCEGLEGQVKRMMRVNKVSKIWKQGNSMIEWYQVVHMVSSIVTMTSRDLV